MSTLACEVGKDAPSVCLFTENPNRLVSLWEIVQPFQAHLFSWLCFLLGQMHQLTKTADHDNGPSLGSVQETTDAIQQSYQLCSYLGLKLSVIQLEEAQTTLSKAVHDAILNGDGTGWPFANRAIFDGAKRVRDELKERMFLAMSDREAKLFASEHPFGSDVSATFGNSAAEDIREAAKCIACERWTASVFHLMRAVEHAIHKVSQNVHVQWPKPWPLELEQWGTIIDQIEKQIKALENLPKGQHKTEVLQAYSQAATTFNYFKDAWRNHVSHSRVNYKPEDAKRIYDNVENFMRDAIALPVL